MFYSSMHLFKGKKRDIKPHMFSFTAANKTNTLDSERLKPVTETNQNYK